MDGHALRAMALDALGPHAELRAKEILERADVVVDEAVRSWAASTGTVRGHRVRVRTDARSLGVTRAVPSVADALHAAFARVFTPLQSESLAELVIEWDGSLRASVESYRGATPIDGRAHLDLAFAEFLDGAGDPAAARYVRGVSVHEAAPEELVLNGHADVWNATAIRDAARALLGERATVAWRGK